jgi:FtsP/CotA-like multicopper oxidase with cupredoxin domain
MPEFLNDLPEPGQDDIRNPIKFEWEEGRTEFGLIDGLPPHFMINGMQFGEHGPKIDQCMPLDGLQEWVLENYTPGVAHPFHIHINPFQVIKIETPTDSGTYSPYAPADNFLWQDVIAVPAAKIVGTHITPGRVVIRQKFRDYSGTFVLHCHILGHEDRGMMQLVRIVPPGKYPDGCQDGAHDHD